MRLLPMRRSLIERAPRSKRTMSASYRRFVPDCQTQKKDSDLGVLHKTRILRERKNRGSKRMNTLKAILMKECGRIERAPVHPIHTYGRSRYLRV